MGKMQLGFLGLSLAGALSFTTSCREEKGKCSNNLDTLCLQFDLADRSTIPKLLEVALTAPGQSPALHVFDAGATLASRPYLVEIEFNPPVPTTLDIDAAGINDVSLMTSALASAHLTVTPQGAARPTVMILGSTGSQGDMGAGDQSGPANDAAGPAGPWLKVYTSMTGKLNAIAGSAGGGAIYVATSSGSVLTSSKGLVFADTKGSVPGGAILTSLWVPSAMEVWTASRGGEVFQTVDGGVNWINKGLTPTKPLYAIFGRSSSDVLAVGSDAAQGVHWNGFNWMPITHNVGPSLGAWASSTRFYVVGQNGNAAVAADPRSTWTAYGQVVSTSDLNAVTGTDDNHVYAVTSIGALLLSNPGASKWDNPVALSTPPLTAVWAKSATEVWITGTSGINGAVWQCTNITSTNASCVPQGNLNLSGYTLTGIWGDGNGGVWVLGNKALGNAIFKF